MIDSEFDAELAYAAWLSEEEKTRQSNIVMARKYYGGDHDAKLTERQKEYLGHQLGDQRFAVNYCATIVNAVWERMIVKAFESEAEDYARWCWDVWRHNRMDAKQSGVHRGTVRDGEYFVFVGWDEEETRPTFIPHPRYTDPQFDGTGFGCKAFYPDDDPNLPLKMVSKRWTETITDERGRKRTRRRMTVYYPDRVEKFVASTSDESGWEKYYEYDEDEDGQQVRRAWPIPWVDGSGQPLGIPFAHFYNPDRRTELWDAVPVQDLINKTALDILATADSAGFPVKIARGFQPTTDGKPPESDGDNYLTIFPGVWIGNVPKDGGIDTIPPADIAKLLESLDSWIVKLAQITDTPISRFQMSRQIAAEGTLKQQEAPLLAKVRARQTLCGNAWEDCLYIARRLANYYDQGVNEDADIETLWESAETRDDKAFREAMMLEAQMGVPREVLWEKLGYDQDDIARMKAMSAEEMQETSNIGGELLRAFEGGGFGGGGPRGPVQRQGANEAR